MGGHPASAGLDERMAHRNPGDKHGALLLGGEVRGLCHRIFMDGGDVGKWRNPTSPPMCKGPRRCPVHQVITKVFALRMRSASSALRFSSCFCFASASLRSSSL